MVIGRLLSLIWNNSPELKRMYDIITWNFPRIQSDWSDYLIRRQLKIDNLFTLAASLPKTQDFCKPVLISGSIKDLHFRLFRALDLQS